MTHSEKNTADLALAAVIVATLFVAPIAPPIGAVLGLVARRRSLPRSPARHNAVAAIIVGSIFTVVQMTCGAGLVVKQVRGHKQNLLRDPVTEFQYRASAFARRSNPRKVPVGESAWTPASIECRPFWRPADTRRAWQHWPWTDLHYTQDSLPFGIQMRYSSDGQNVTLRVRADPDCCGKPGEWHWRGKINTRDDFLGGPFCTNEHY